jgi:hypothetical protein
MHRTLITLDLALLIASCASAQQAAYTPRPKRYDPARPHYHRYHRNYRNHYGHGRHHSHRRYDHGRDSYTEILGRHDGRRHRASVRGSGPASGDRASRRPGERGGGTRRRPYPNTPLDKVEGGITCLPATSSGAYRLYKQKSGHDIPV